MPGFVHQVEMKLPAGAAPERLRRIEGWCVDWQIGFRVLDRFPGSENVRIAFEDHRLARAFVGHFGGCLSTPASLRICQPSLRPVRTPTTSRCGSIRIDRTKPSDDAGWSLFHGCPSCCERRQAWRRRHGGSNGRR